MKYRLWGYVLGCVLGCVLWGWGNFAQAATTLDPNLKWKTIETLHFRINYYPEIEHAALKMAQIAEEVYSRLSPLLKHTPDLKTDIVLMDTTDDTNGFTTVMPNPLITIYLADMGSNLRPVSYDDWLRYVFTHEYSHLLNMDTFAGGDAFLKMILGRFIFPNAFTPQFLIEGLATYIESEQAKGGRAYDTRWLAMLRMDALEGKYKTIEQASVSTIRWPMGNLSYLYGVSFLEYLSRQYGEDKIYRLSYEGDNLFSGGMDYAFNALYGKPLYKLWFEWLEDLTLQSKAERAKIAANPLTKPKMLTNKGYYILKPKWSSDGNEIFYSQINADDSSQLRKINVANLMEEKIMDGMFFDDSLCTFPGTLYYSKADIYNNFYIYKDLYSYDLKNRSIKKITNGARAADPAVSKDGKRIAFTKNHKGIRTLWVMGLEDRKPQMIGTLETGVQYFSPSFTPDGNDVIAAKWLGSKQKIVVINVQTNAERYLTPNNMSLEANPCITPDGRYILFDSDFTRIVNIYAFDMKTSKVYQVTNVLGIATMADVSPDQKKIVYVNYSAQGYDLAQIDFNPKSWIKVNNFPNDGIQKQINYSSPNDLILKKYDYNPLPSVVPKFWLPLSFQDENGTHMLAYTSGYDALMQQSYLINVGMDWKARRPAYSLIYTNDQLLPQIQVVMSDIPYAYSWDSYKTTYWERDRQNAVYCGLYDNRVFSEYDRQAVFAGYEYNNLSNISSIEPLVLKPSLGNLQGIFLGYIYTSLRMYPYSVVPEEGHKISTTLRMYSKDIGSDYNLINYMVTGSKYFKTFIPHNIIGVSATGSLNYGDPIAQSGYSYKQLSLRGYPTLVAGTKSAKGTLSYSFPLQYPETGTGYGSFFFDKLWGALFFDCGGATYGSASSINWKRSYGAEFDLQTTNGWGLIPIIFQLVYANGIDAGGQEMVTFNISL